jgi:hypothetical protein
VARRLGLPLEAVRRRRRTLGPTRPRGRPYQPAEDAALRNAIVAGRSLRELAFQLGRPGDALRLRARSLHHLPPAAAGLTPGELRLIARECAGGGPGRVLAVARRLGRPPAEVRRQAKQLAPAQETDITAQPAPTTGPRAAA